MIFYLGEVDITKLEEKLQQKFKLKYFSHVDLIKEEYSLNTKLGQKTYECITEQYLPEMDVIFELLEAYFARSTDSGMSFSPFFEKEYWAKFLKLHETYKHSLYFVHFHETAEHRYERSLKTAGIYLDQVPGYREMLWSKAENHYNSIQGELALTEEYPHRLILDAHLPLEEQYAKIVEFFM